MDKENKHITKETMENKEKTYEQGKEEVINELNRLIREQGRNNIIFKKDIINLIEKLKDDKNKEV